MEVRDYYFSFYLGLDRNVGILEGFLMPVLATMRTTAVSSFWAYPECRYYWAQSHCKP